MQLLPLKQRTTGETSRPQKGGYKNLVLNINVTAITSTPSVDVILENYVGDDHWVPAWKLSEAGGSPLTATGRRIILLRAQLGAVQNASYYTQVAEIFLSGEWRVRTVHADADAITYSIDAKV